MEKNVADNIWGFTLHESAVFYNIYYPVKPVQCNMPVEGSPAYYGYWEYIAPDGNDVKWCMVCVATDRTVWMRSQQSLTLITNDSPTFEL